MDRRFLAALALSAAVVVLWYSVIHPLVFPARPLPPPAVPEEPAAAPGPKKAEPEPAPAPPKPAPEPAGKAPALEPTRARPGREAVLQGDRFRIELTSDGAAMRRLVLTEGFLDPSQTEAYALVREIEDGVRSFLLAVEGAPEDLRTVPWEVAEQGPDRVVYSFRTSSGLEVRKAFFLPVAAAPYTFGLRLEWRNVSGEERRAVARLHGAAGVPQERPDQPDVRASVGWGVDPKKPKVDTFSPSEVADAPKPVPSGPFHYAAVGNKYFANAILIGDPESVESVWVEGVTDSRQLKELTDVLGAGSKKAKQRAASNARTILRMKEIALPKDGTAAQDFLVFAGPKREEWLRLLSLEGLRTSNSQFACIPASWTRGLSWLMFVVLDFFDRIAGNWGVAIILLTLLVRLLMVPLSVKMQVSMTEYQKKMKKIQPKMEEIKTKYKDKARQQQEMAKLMREHGVSLFPVKGCLPVLAQFPIFIALYSTLQNTLELRHAHFLYIVDLASPDRLFEFPAFVPLIPWIGGILGSWFNLLPVLWIGLMLLQQKFTPMPQSNDPQVETQRKMMLFMSVVFGILFFTIESGCAIYIITSTVWGMGEGYLIRRRMKAMETTP